MNEERCPVCGQELTPERARQCLEEHYGSIRPGGPGAAAAIENWEFLQNIAEGGEEEHV